MSGRSLTPVEVAFARDLTTLYFRDKGGKAYALDDTEGLKSFQKELEGKKSRICAFLMGNDFSNEDMESEILWAVDACQVARNSKVDVIRIDMAPHNENLSYKDFLHRCIKAVERMSN